MPPKNKKKCDPRLASAARELRDRWLERVNAESAGSPGKYEISRLIETTRYIEPAKLLKAA